MSIEELDVAEKRDEIPVELFRVYITVLNVAPEEIDVIETAEKDEDEDMDERSVSTDASKSRSMRRLVRFAKALRIRRR